MARKRGRLRPKQSTNEARERRLLLPIFVVLALVLGGASAPVSTGAFLLQSLSLLIALLAAIQLRDPSPTVVNRAVVIVGAAFLALLVLQLAPLPFGLWSGLPGREAVFESMREAGIEPDLLPVSLVPQLTVMSALAAVPVVCLLLLFLRQKTLGAETVARVIVGVALVSLLLGIAQVQSGRESPLYFHAITNRGSAVGFFANANHLATLLLVSIPLFAAQAVTLARAGRVQVRYAMGATIAYAAAVAVGIYLTASVAGALLLIPTTAASLLVFGRWNSKAAGIVTLLAAAVSITGLGFWSAGDLPLLQTSLGAAELDRLGIANTSSAALHDYWPIGSGLGTFPEIYPLFENPQAVTATFVNHAHNDYLELLVETGLIGAVLIAGFLAWWGLQVLRVWTGRSGGGEAAVWQRAATIVIGVILAHSLVDYPLRTPAMLVVFAYWTLFLASRAEAVRRARFAQPQVSRTGARHATA